MSDPDRPLPFDPDRALYLAHGETAVRDEILIETLAFLDAGVAPLLDTASYRRDPAVRRELAHKGEGLVKQAAMPELAAIFGDLHAALESGRVAEAERLGRTLPEAIRRARTAIAYSRRGRP